MPRSVRTSGGCPTAWTLSVRENFMRNASLEGHDWIPVHTVLSDATWYELREELEDVCLRHPALFPGFEKGGRDFDAIRRSEEQKTWTDDWGCRWRAELDGMTGQVFGHPLDDWAKFESWVPPSFSAGATGRLDDEGRRRMRAQEAGGELVQFGLGHGFLFMRLCDLRGFENFMTDVATEDPRLSPLVEIVVSYAERRVLDHLDAGVDLLSGGDDLGTQKNSMLGPAHFRRWIAPGYRRIFKPARERGAHTLLHSDGYIMDIMEDIIDCGVSIVNPQDLVNGVDSIARNIKGRVCIRLDVDRQSVLPFGSPADVRGLIREEVMKLGSPAGGLEFVVGIYPPTPARNIDALLSAFEEFRTYWVGRG